MIPITQCCDPAPRHSLALTVVFLTVISRRQCNVLGAASAMALFSVLIGLIACGGSGSENHLSPLNPVPVVSRVSPDAVVANSSAFTLVINGSNFVNSAKVQFNGKNGSTTYVSSTQLSAVIPACDLGVYSVTVTNPSPGGGVSNSIPFIVGNPVPAISSLNVTGLPANSPAFTLVISGSNFVNSARVQFNGQDRATTYVNSTQLNAAILASDVANAGLFPVSATNPAPGGGMSNSVQFTVASPPRAQIQHIIVIVAENHSFDNYFGQFPGANGATSGETSTGQTVPLVEASDTPYNCAHGWAAAHNEINGGLMNGFDLVCPNLGAYVQYSASQIPSYWQLAQTYALADNMFAEVAAPSFPAHSYIFSGSSNNAINNPSKEPNEQQYGWGCDAAALGAIVESINPNTNSHYNQPTCFTLKTMGDILDEAGISWRDYSPQPGTDGYIWNFISYFDQLWNGADRHDSVANSQFQTDIANCQLPQVAWITPPNGVSEHPPNSVTRGMNWTAQQISAVMNSTCGYWQNAAIILTWDDWGGFYDHVPPPQWDFFGYGIRVPLLMISPYSKPGYISHTLYSFDSINAFIEHTFQTGCLISDCLTMTNDLSDMLNLSQTPLSRIQLKTLPAARMKYPYTVDEQIITHDDDDD